MRRRRVLLATVTAALLPLGAGCRDEGDDGGEPLATTTSAAPVATTTSVTAPAAPTAPQPTGEDAVGVLLDAWRAGDRPAALTVATATAVDALFAIAPETGQARGCNAPGANANISCVFRLDAGELQVRAVLTADGAGYVVDFVILGS